MRALVVYFSRSGRTGRVAGEVASRLGCDVEALVPRRGFRGPIGWLRAGRSAIKGTPIELEPMARDPGDYDLVVVGTPVWAGTVSSVVRSFLVQNVGRLGNVGFLVTSGGKNTGPTLKALEELSGKAPRATLCVRSRDVGKGGQAKFLDAFVTRLRDVSDPAPDITPGPG